MRKSILLIALALLCVAANGQKCLQKYLQTVYVDNSSVPDVADVHIDFFYTLMVGGKSNNDSIVNCFDKFDAASKIVDAISQKTAQGYHLEQLHVVDGRNFSAIMRNDAGHTFIFRPDVVPFDAFPEPENVQCVSFNRDGIYCIVYKDGTYKTNSDDLRAFLMRETKMIASRAADPNLVQDIDLHNKTLVVVYKDGFINWRGDISPQLQEAIENINSGDWERNNKYSDSYARVTKVRYSDRDGRFFIFNSYGPMLYSIF